MHDTLEYFEHDPIHRRFHHDELTFRAVYAFTENFVLPLSHDEVVHGKGSLLGQDAGRRVAEVRQPAAALRLQVRAAGQEAAVHGRRDRASGASGTTTASLDWHLLDQPAHAGVARWVARPQPRCYRDEPALHELDSEPAGFEWVERRRPRRRACSRSCGAAAGGAPVLVRRRTSRRCRAATIASACRAGGRWRELAEQRRRATTAASGVGNLGGVERAARAGPRPLVVGRADAAAAVGVLVLHRSRRAA